MHSFKGRRSQKERKNELPGNERAQDDDDDNARRRSVVGNNRDDNEKKPVGNQQRE